MRKRGRSCGRFEMSGFGRRSRRRRISLMMWRPFVRTGEWAGARRRAALRRAAHEWEKGVSACCHSRQRGYGEEVSACRAVRWLVGGGGASGGCFGKHVYVGGGRCSF